MMPYIYLIVFIAWAILFVAYFIESRNDKYIFLMLGGIMLVVLGIHIIKDGLADVTNVTTEAFGIIHLGVAFYILLKSNFEMWEIGG
jgi:hypothetical protein